MLLLEMALVSPAWVSAWGYNKKSYPGGGREGGVASQNSESSDSIYRGSEVFVGFFGGGGGEDIYGAGMVEERADGWCRGRGEEGGGCRRVDS